MRPIRILVDTLADDGLLNAQMGNAREIITRLDSDNFHVSTFMLGRPDARIAQRKNTRLIQLPERRQTVRILSEFLLGAHDLLFYLKASPASKWYLGLRKKWRDRRVVIGTIESQCNLRDLDDFAPDALRLWEQTILRCDRLYSNSPYVQQSLSKEYGFNSEVIPTGADTRFFTPCWEKLRNSRPQVLFVGSLRPRKQPGMVLKAAGRFPDADFKIVGEGPLGKELLTRMAQDGLRNVTLTGALGVEKLREEYRRADVFFFPSSFEGSPKVIVEAAACGLPVVCRACYSPETVLHGVTGFQVSSDSELYSCLHLLLASAGLRLRMGRAGRELSQRFDWDLITRQWEETFFELAQREELGRAS
jgi:glycosyltransferase involved in cell wall biosynthesis